jgi:hypothetical protein
MEHVAGVTDMKLSVADWNLYALFGNRRQAQHGPLVGTAWQDTGEVILVQPLHHQHDAKL